MVVLHGGFTINHGGFTIEWWKYGAFTINNGIL